MASRSQNVIKTERLLLHPLHIDHADAVYALRSDPKVFYWKTPENRLESDEWLEARLVSKKILIYIVELRASLENEGPASHPLPEEKPRIIGLTGAHTLPEIGYLFIPYSWGHGYATKALQAWMEWYWTMWPEGHPSVDESERGCLKAESGPDGEGSRGVLRKCGFKHTGTRGVEEVVGWVALDC